jgi:hypothetical protein
LVVEQGVNMAKAICRQLWMADLVLAEIRIQQLKGVLVLVVKAIMAEPVQTMDLVSMLEEEEGVQVVVVNLEA